MKECLIEAMQDSNKLVANEKEADILIRQLLNIGEAMYQCGGEISRIEDSLHRLGKVYGAKHISVYAITSSIVITAEFTDDYSVTQIRRIKNRGFFDCLKMENLNQLCRDCVSSPIPVELLQEKVLEIIGESPNKKYIYLGQLIAVLAFTFFFGGSLPDAAVATAGAVLICLIQQYVKRYFSSEFFYHIGVSLTTGVFVNIVSLIIPGIHVSEILIGDIMILIPGTAITNSIRYIFSGDIVSSFEKLMDSLIQAFGIAIGFMLSLLLIKVEFLNAPVMAEPMKSLMQIIAAGFSTVGFCMAFNMRKKFIPITAVGGIICWSGYLLMENRNYGVFISTLVAAILVGIFGDVVAHMMKIPTTIFFIPACIPMIPGKNLYYMALSMIASDWSRFMHNLELLALYTIGIALGLALVGEVDKLLPKRE